MPSFVARLRQSILDLPLRPKLLVALLVTAVLPLVGIAVFSVGFSLTSADRALATGLGDKLNIVLLILDNASATLAGADRQVAADHALGINLDLGLTQSVDQYLNRVVADQGLDFAYIVDPQGRELARSGEPVPALPSDPAALGAWSGGGGRSFWLAPQATLAALAPILSGDDRLLGYVCIGWQLAQVGASGGKALLERVAAQSRSEVFVAPRGGPLNPSGGLSGLVLDAEGLLASMPTETNRLELRFDHSGSWQGLAAGLRDAQGKDVVLLGVARPLASLEADRWLSLGVIFLIFALAFLLSLLVARWFAGTIARPVLAVAEATREIIKGNFDLSLAPQGRDEIGLMTEDFSVMTLQLRRLVGDLEHEVEEHRAAEAEIRSLNEELEHRVAERTEELSRSLEQLRTTQASLVESEKMAALSSLVVGIAHELNTPIGNSVTAASFLEHQAQELASALSQGDVAPAVVQRYLGTFLEGAALNRSSLERAARLVNLFKELAVNRDDEAPQVVNLRRLADEIWSSRDGSQVPGHPSLRNEIPESMALTTRVHALSRVLMSLVDNALDHGFPGGREGQVRFSVQWTSEQLELGVEDNGVGLSEDDQKRVFEPFFTTARSGGHLGLGLTLAFNLVTHRLGGTLSCQSQPGQGSRFVVRLPS